MKTKGNKITKGKFLMLMVMAMKEAMKTNRGRLVRWQKWHRREGQRLAQISTSK